MLCAPGELPAQIPQPQKPVEVSRGENASRPPVPSPEDSAPTLAAGLQFPEQFLPLGIGMRWTYELELNGKKQPRHVIIEIMKMVIHNFRSYYLLNRFPFAAVEISETPTLRYDRRMQTFYQLAKDQDIPLFPVEGDQAVDYSFGKTADGKEDQKILKLSFSPILQIPIPGAPEEDEVVLELGVGVISARLATDVGVYHYTLVKSEKIDAAAAATKPQELVTHELPPPVIKPPEPYAATGPELTMTVEAAPAKVTFTLRVQNKQDKMIPLNFDTDQSFDFLVASESSTEPIWQWSKTHSFAKVKRSVGLLPGESKEFTAEWDAQDSERRFLPAGKYQVVGILTSKPEVRTPPATFTLAPPPEP
jgi:hypothetical protein